MDKNALVEAAARRTANADQQLAAEQVERVVDALFGTVEHPGVIAEGLKRGETVTVLGFGAFHLDDQDRATLRPGQALNEYVSGAVG
ncbi:HU family DNA-binding protein [Streptomyces pilosus]|uniref:HU family DNA-binding protein n=1 Tax=Streptomyces pilosus TaxID=28893 RepID=UPI0036C86286